MPKKDLTDSEANLGEIRFKHHEQRRKGKCCAKIVADSDCLIVYSERAKALRIHVRGEYDANRVAFSLEEFASRLWLADR